MQAAAELAVKVIEGYKTNKIIMEFVTNEALEKVAAEISAKPGRSCTAAAVKLFIQSVRNENIKKRVDDYINLGLFGCYLKSLGC